MMHGRHVWSPAEYQVSGEKFIGDSISNTDWKTRCLDRKLLHEKWNPKNILKL